MSIMLGAGHKGPSGRTTKYFSLFQADMFFIWIQRVAKGSKEANFLPTLIRLRIEHMLHSIIIVLYNIILGIKRPRNNNISHIHIWIIRITYFILHCKHMIICWMDVFMSNDIGEHKQFPLQWLAATKRASCSSKTQRNIFPHIHHNNINFYRKIALIHQNSFFPLAEQ